MKLSYYHTGFAITRFAHPGVFVEKLVYSLVFVSGSNPAKILAVVNFCAVRVFAIPFVCV